MKKGNNAVLKGRYIIPAVILFLPFLVFYWFVPFLDDLTIGNDYQVHSIYNQMELQFSILHGSFPLYVPGYAGGTSASALTLGQVFHPISHLAALLPGYWTGKALEWNTLLRLLSLGLTHLVLFYFLRRLKLRVDISLILSFITVYNLRMLDMFRYGASLENYTAFLLLCVAIAWRYIEPAKYWGPLWIIGATYLLACGGHPQMMYYGFMGAGLVTLVFPFFLSSILPETHTSIKKILKFYLHIFTFCTIGILISSAYIFSFYFDFVAESSRTNLSYAWAAGLTDTVTGTLNNFFRPFYSDVHGAFGGSSLYVVGATIPLLLVFTVKIPKIIWFIWMLFILIFLYMQGSRVPVHHFVWEYLPLASSFRIPGRISMILPLIILLLLAWLMRCDKVHLSYFGKKIEVYPYVLLSCVALLFFVLYNFILFPFLRDPEIYSPARINKIPSWVESIGLWSGIISLIFLIFYGPRRPIGLLVSVTLCLMIFLQTTTNLRYGTWITEKRDTPSLEQMEDEKIAKLIYHRLEGVDIYSRSLGEFISLLYPSRSTSRDFTLTQYFQRIPMASIYWDYFSVSSREEAYKILQKLVQGGRTRSTFPLMIEKYEPPKDFNPTPYRKKDSVDRVILEYSSFNQLRFNVSSHAPGFFVLFFPHSQNWRAYVNSEKVSIYRAIGIFQSVWVPEGESLVEFRYWSSAAFWGILVSLITLSLVVLYFIGNLSSNPIRRLSIFMVLALGTSMFFWWYLSLYSGDNLGTKYEWPFEAQATIETSK